MTAMNKQSIKDYYQTEMQLLNEASSAFAMKHPKQAGHMNIDSLYDRDPHIARLFEGSAYLNARVKQQIDYGVAHIGEALLRQLAPQYLRPYPSMCVVQLNSLDQRIREKQWIPAGSRLRSEAVGEEKTACEFTTAQPIEWLPLQLLDAELVSGAHEGGVLSLTFKWHEGVDVPALGALRVPLFINTAPELACLWHDLLINKSSDVFLSCSKTHRATPQLPARMSAMNFDSKDGMMPQLERHLKAFELLSDYFLFKEKYHFVMLTLPAIDFHSPVFEIRIEWREPLQDLRLSKDLFKLHCVPAANIFQTSAEPLRYQAHQSQYPIKVALGQPLSQKLLAIRQVSAYKRQALRPIEIHDYYQKRHRDTMECYYRLSEVMIHPDEPQHALVFSGPAMEEMHISCDVLAYNGHYPRQFLPPFSLKLADERLPSFLQASNLTRPTRFYRPVLSRDYVTGVLSQINTRFESLANLEHFQQLLHLHDWSGDHERQIHAIMAIDFKPYNRLEKGMLLRGVLIELKMDEAGFSSLSELGLFSSVIHHFIRYFSPMNTQLQTQIETFPSGKQITWINDV